MYNSGLTSIMIYKYSVGKGLVSDSFSISMDLVCSICFTGDFRIKLDCSGDPSFSESVRWSMK